MELTAAASNTISDYLRAAAQPYAAPVLISPETMNAIQAVADLLPGGLTEFFGFECPLGSVEGKADFLVSAGSATGGRDVLAGRKPGRELPARFREEPIWARVFDFAKVWSDPGSPLFENVQNLWLEFDIDGKPPSIPLPSVFMGSGTLCGTLDCRWLTGVAIPMLRGRQEDEAVVRRIDGCLKLLTPGAHIFQVGIMLARQAAAVRLCVRGVPAYEIAGYAAECGWRGPAEELRSLSERLAGMAQRVDLDMDAGADMIRPKLGLECYPSTGGPALRRLLNGLVAQGLCTPRKAEALAAWTGIATERVSRQVWPQELLQMSGILGGRFFSAFYRWVHHVKVIFEPGQPLEAKAYLAVRHVWLDPSRVRDLMAERPPERIENECQASC